MPVKERPVTHVQSRSGGVVFFDRRESAEVTLFCFPYAGSNAGRFSDWLPYVPEWMQLCAIQYPGRGGRIAQPLENTMAGLLDSVISDLLLHLECPLALFGHSVGAIAAFEMARRLETQLGIKPVHLFVSGRPAPHQAFDQSPTHDLPLSEFLQVLRRLNGTPPEVFDNEALLPLVIPALRADFAISEAYRYEPGPALSCPITAFGGVSDPTVRLERLLAWGDYTTRRFIVKVFSGGHFFLNTEQRGLLATISEQLRESIAIR